jgi:predicted HicB family RNase H-like nuclease
MDKIKSIRFSEELEKKIRVMAAEEGISFGEWIRMSIIEKVNNLTHTKIVKKD